jgi:hypothetical protein
MLHLTTGTPGASKTAFIVSKLDEIERKNKINLSKNTVVHNHNLSLFEKFRDDFDYLDYEVGSGHELKREILNFPKDYWDFLTQEFDDLRPDYYFQRSMHYNEIIERINDRDGQQKFEFLQPVRTIYTNINALKIDYARALIKDWRDAPDGSIFVIDEVQNVSPYSDQKSKDPIILDLTIHRHRGFDFYFITQSPSFLHTVVRELIGVHWHITRPYGRTPKVYQFGSCRQYPNTLVNKLNCESKFSFKPQPRIFKLYKSTTINTHQKRLPAGLIPLVIFLGIASMMMMWGLADKKKAEEITGKTNVPSVSTVSTPNSLSASNVSDNFNPSLECRKAVNLEKPECVKWFDQISKNKNSVSSTGAVVEAVSYNPNKPYDFEYQPQVTPTDFPKMSGVIKLSSGKLIALDQQGNYMQNVSQDDCKKWLSGYRPFNYFAQQKQSTERVSTSESENINFATSSL